MMMRFFNMNIPFTNLVYVFLYILAHLQTVIYFRPRILQGAACFVEEIIHKTSKFSWKSLPYYENVEKLLIWNILTSVVDTKEFILDPYPELNFPTSGTRQKFRIHADPDPSHNI